jgi:hypothetical protein
MTVLGGLWGEGAYDEKELHQVFTLQFRHYIFLLLKSRGYKNFKIFFIF